MLGETEQDKYGNNVNTLLERFGIQIANDTVQDYAHNLGAPSWILPELGEGARGREGDLLARVDSACLYRATTLRSVNGSRVLARAQATSSAPGEPMIVAGAHGDGRVVVLADSDLFGDDCIGELDHRALWLNIVDWVAGGGSPAARAEHVRSRMARTSSPAWAQLRDETNALALLQSPDGSLTAAAAAGGPRRRDDRRDRPPRVSLPPSGGVPARRPSRSSRLGRRRLRAPDFTRSLDVFRPERDRRDGVENLVVLPDVQAERIPRYLL